MSEEHNGLSRRDLLRAASLGAVALGAATAAQAQAGNDANDKKLEAKPKTEDRNKNKALPRRRLGRTNMMVTVLGAGASGISGPEILDRAITNGVNYIDTAPVYDNTGSESIIGEVMKTRRNEVFLATKWHVFNADASVDQYLDLFNKSLKRLQTDHVDLLQLHSVDVADDPKASGDGFRRIDSPNLHKAMEIVKRDGKVRYFGVSSHNTRRKDLLIHAIDTGLFDTILVAFNYSNFDQSAIAELLDHAKKKDIGVIGMKAGAGNIHVPNVKPLSAQLAWVLSKDIHTVINSKITSTEEGQDTALAAAKVKITQIERDTLEKYAAAVHNEYCRGCSHICEGACPENVKIADILRFDMYHRHYGGGHQAKAVDSYAKLATSERVQSLCGTCRKCEVACPYDLPIVDKLLYAERTLA